MTPSETAMKDAYDEMLDCYGPVKIGNLEYSASWVLEQVDPTAYRIGLDEYSDMILEEDTDTTLEEEVTELFVKHVMGTL